MSKCVLYIAQRVRGQCFEIREWVHAAQNELANSEELCIYYRLGQSFWELLCGVMCWACDLLMAFMLTLHWYFALYFLSSVLTSLS